MFLIYDCNNMPVCVCLYIFHIRAESNIHHELKRSANWTVWTQLDPRDCTSFSSSCLFCFPLHVFLCCYYCKSNVHNKSGCIPCTQIWEKTKQKSPTFSSAVQHAIKDEPGQILLQFSLFIQRLIAKWNAVKWSGLHTCKHWCSSILFVFGMRSASLHSICHFFCQHKLSKT